MRALLYAMKIHEYQAKELLKKFNVPVPQGIVAQSPEAAYQAAKEVAAKTPEKIFKETVNPAVGFRPFQARKLAFALQLPNELISTAAKFMQSLYAAFESMDASLVEINPFLLTKDNRLIALDAKINFDDNALFRHPDFRDLRDLNEEEPLEIEASKFDLNYIKLDGNIACMVNGAGLAMATMDIIKLAGGGTAKLLYVGGGAFQGSVSGRILSFLSGPPRQHWRL